MKKLLQTLLSIDTAFLFSLWVLWTANATRAMEIFDVSRSSSAGLNLLKSQVGGTYLIFTIFVVLFFSTNQNHWGQAAAISVGAVLVTRVISLTFHGFSTYGLIAVANEIFLIMLLMLLLRKYS